MFVRFACSTAPAFKKSAQIRAAGLGLHSDLRATKALSRTGPCAYRHIALPGSLTWLSEGPHLQMQTPLGTVQMCTYSAL